MRTRFVVGLLVSIVSVGFSTAPLAEPAGRLVYAHGDVSLRGADGQARAVDRGATVEAGDTVVTGSGRTQLSFADGGFVAVQPNTQFRVDEYRYGGREDGSERSFFALLKGGIRFISGAIGHRNQDTYRIRTPVATIGIRGSGGRVDVCEGGSCPGLEDGTYLTGNQDTVTLTNGTGTTEVEVGQTFHTQCSTCPVKQVKHGPNAYSSTDGNGNRTAEEPGFMAGAQVDEHGNPLAVSGFDSVPVTGTGSYLIEGVASTLTSTGPSFSQTFAMTTDVVLELDFATGAMTGFIAGNYDDGETAFGYLADAAGGQFTNFNRTAGSFSLVGDPTVGTGCIGGPCGNAPLNGSSTYDVVGTGAAVLDGQYTMTGTGDSGNTIVIQGAYSAPQDAAPAP